MLTAYDAPMASFIDQAGVDLVLVSDAVGTVGNGRSEAVSVTVEEMIYHTRAVRNGVKRAMVVTTLPFGSYSGPEDAVRTATRLMKEGGADGVHLEGTSREAGLDTRHHGRGHPGDGARRRHQAEDRQRRAASTCPGGTLPRPGRSSPTRLKWRTTAPSR